MWQYKHLSKHPCVNNIYLNPGPSTVPKLSTECKCPLSIVLPP
ncbi:formate acetyltransferase activating enzyme [Staphylococcus aureus subsp. aureus 122051]|nr:formate acetyltransferase activating enzyme [Staphylococcus aureus subsp. aureus str. Newbould 305]EOR37855.1 formate acetyltransferase activating enzyme [Staphylococcus aureus subsp. aureus MRGR3]EOR42735.1 formate acetyltransferase activating enzyme [Staphylococcus aureus subsp. aureus 122051]EOR48808.1 formate acetyltransferase activating enzyme [Staphylococcus aureus subsp. aureus 112808A]